MTVRMTISGNISCSPNVYCDYCVNYCFHFMLYIYHILFSTCIESVYIYIYIYIYILYIYIYVLHIYSIFVIHTVMLLSLHKIISPPVILRSWYCDNKVIWF